MITFNVATLTHGVEFSQLQLRAIFRSIGYQAPPASDTLLPELHCLQIWTAMLISRLKFLDAEQRTLLVDELLPAIKGWLDAETDPKLQLVVIADSRYATWYNRTGWLDLTTGATVTSPQHAPLETLAYNLDVLFRRNHAACTMITERETHDESTSNT